MKKYLLLLIIILLNFNYASAEEAKEKAVTRAEVIDKISAADFFKKKIGDLLSWSIGYDITKINRTNLAPTLSWINVVPGKTPPDDRTIVTLTTKVSDPSGLDNIKGVRADMSSIGKLPNMMLVDNGLWGDTKANDGIFTLQTSVSYGVANGAKEIPVAVSNKSGWVAINKTKLDVESNPIISEAQATPSSIHADGLATLLISAKVENSGRQEDLKEITVNLTSIGLESNVRMWDNGTHGDVKAGDKIFSVSVIPKAGTSPGEKKLIVSATNMFGGKSEGEISLVVQ